MINITNDTSFLSSWLIYIFPTTPTNPQHKQNHSYANNQLMLATCQCWLRANAGYAPMLAMCQCWLCANAGYAPMLAMRQCWLCANAGCVPMLAVCQCWLCANAGYAPMLAMCQCWLSVNAVAQQACTMRFSHHAVTPTMPTSVEAPIVSVKQGALVQYFSNSNVLVLCSHLTTCLILCRDRGWLSKCYLLMETRKTMQK